LAIIVWGLGFFEGFLDGINLAPIAWVVDKIGNLIKILLALVSFRLVSEIAIAIFRINDNLSPDGGKSELVDIDPVEEARKAAELAAARTREATRSVSENAAEMGGNVSGKAKAATASVREKAGDLKSKASKTIETKKTPDPKPVEPPKKPSTAKKPTSKPKTTTSKTKAKTSKTTTKRTTAKKPAAKTTSSGKRGPKPGTKIPRDKDGNLLKKDGTPRKKPGPKK